MYDTEHDYTSRLDALARRPPPTVFSRRYLGFAGALTCVRGALAAPELAAPLLLAAVGFVCVACWPRRRPAGQPIPPKQMRKMLRRGRAYAHGTHHVIVDNGIYAYVPQTGCYERVPDAMDPLLAAHWVGEQRSARFHDSLVTGAWLGYLWRH
jgi:hypothetical protein